MSYYKRKGIRPQRVFLTPWAAETARAAGITQIRPLKPEIERIGRYINQYGRPEYPFPENFDEAAIVLRWGGKGHEPFNRLMPLVPLHPNDI